MVYSESDDDSIEAAVSDLRKQKLSGIKNSANRSIGEIYSGHHTLPVSTVQSPLDADSSWSSSTTIDDQVERKGIQSLIQRNPLLNTKPNGAVWDDSRPLSADLKHSSSTTSDASDDNNNDQPQPWKKTSVTDHSLAINNTTLSNLVVRSIPHRESTGIENLTKTLDANLNQASTKQ
jgi:hypothetical protein